MPLRSFYIPEKCQKPSGFLMLFGRYRKRPPAYNELKTLTLYIKYCVNAPS